MRGKSGNRRKIAVCWQEVKVDSGRKVYDSCSKQSGPIRERGASEVYQIATDNDIRCRGKSESLECLAHLSFQVTLASMQNPHSQSNPLNPDHQTHPLSHDS
jgi:hypothetical protein